MSIEATEPPVERRHEDMVGVGSAKLYLFSAIFLTALMVVCSFALVIAQMVTHPEQKLDVNVIVKYVAYFLMGIIVALFAGAGINVLKVLNGQQAMLIRVVAEKERTKGYVEGLKENPSTNIS